MLKRSRSPAPVDERLFDEFDRSLLDRVRPYTMTSPARIVALRDAVEYVVRAGIPGSFVECGVWQGGSCMAMALTLQRLDARRDIYLYDTFEGMTTPTAADTDREGRPAVERLAIESRKSNIWAIAPEEEVRRNLRSTGYDESLTRFVVGPVEETLPDAAPREIALLRLDTDWYESTRHELTHLVPRVADGGVLIIDDYGHWRGARKAVDDFLSDWPYPLFLSRIDYTGRIGVVTRGKSNR